MRESMDGLDRPSKLELWVIAILQVALHLG